MPKAAITALSISGLLAVVFGAAFWLSRISAKAAISATEKKTASDTSNLLELEKKAAEAQANALNTDTGLTEALANGKF